MTQIKGLRYLSSSIAIFIGIACGPPANAEIISLRCQLHRDGDSDFTREYDIDTENNEVTTTSSLGEHTIQNTTRTGESVHSLDEVEITARYIKTISRIKNSSEIYTLTIDRNTGVATYDEYGVKLNPGPASGPCERVSGGKF